MLQVVSSTANCNSTLLDSISDTIESNSKCCNSINVHISSISESLYLNSETQRQSLADINETINDLAKQVKRLENAIVRPSPYTLRSCSEIKQVWPELPSGYYTLTDIYGNQHSNMYCNMEELCGSSEGWTRLAYLDMNSAGHSCGQELGTQFKEYTNDNKRACGKKDLITGCVSKVFDNFNLSYSEVCGKVLAYQYWSPDGISSRVTNIDSYYLDGVSLTYGTNPRQHIWSFLGGFNENNPKCPCAVNSQNPTKDFVGDDYFCESGTSEYGRKLFTDDQLWDGEDCNGVESTCCSNGPWFKKELPAPVLGNKGIELRLCGSSSDEDTPLTYYEIYVK